MGQKSMDGMENSFTQGWFIKLQKNLMVSEELLIKIMNCLQMDNLRMGEDTAISDLYNKVQIHANGNFKMGN